MDNKDYIIGLCEEKQPQRIGNIPKSILWVSAIVLTLIVVAVISALSMIPYPYRIRLKSMIWP